MLEMFKTLKFEVGGKDIYVEEGHKVVVTDNRGVVYEGTICKIQAKEFQLIKDDDKETVVIKIDNVIKTALM
jgi:hypothetical protein